MMRWLLEHNNSPLGRKYLHLGKSVKWASVDYSFKDFSKKDFLFKEKQIYRYVRWAKNTYIILAATRSRYGIKSVLNKGTLT